MMPLRTEKAPPTEARTRGMDMAMEEPMMGIRLLRITPMSGHLLLGLAGPARGVEPE